MFNAVLVFTDSCVALAQLKGLPQAGDTLEVIVFIQVFIHTIMYDIISCQQVSPCLRGFTWRLGTDCRSAVKLHLFE